MRICWLKYVMLTSNWVSIRSDCILLDSLLDSFDLFCFLRLKKIRQNANADCKSPDNVSIFYCFFLFFFWKFETNKTNCNMVYGS